MKKFKRLNLSTLQNKITLVTTIFTLVGALSISTITYYVLSPELITAEQTKAVAVTDLIEPLINVSAFEEIADTKSTNSVAYQALKRTFLRYTTLLGKGNLSAVIDAGDDTYMYIVDGGEKLKLGHIEPANKFPKEIGTAFETGKVQYSGIYEHGERDIEYISAFRPIKSVEGNVIGMIISDYDVTHLVIKLDEVRDMAVISAGILVLVLLTLNTLILRRFFKPLGTLSDAMLRISKGDLMVELNTSRKDEIGDINQALNATVNSLKRMIDNITISAEDVYSKSATILIGAETATRSTETIATITEEVTLISREQSKNAVLTSDNMAVVMQSVNDIYAKIDYANKVSHDTRTSTEEGSILMNDSYTQMGSISSSVNHTKEIVTELASQMDKIKGIVTTISDISDQTNLLALNAAIEAARAGEQGRGFAIVAEEVRRLAGASQSATSEIESIMTYLGRHTQSILDSTGNNINAVNDGQCKLELANQAIDQIKTYNVELETIVKDIRVYADSIVTQSENINSSVNDLQHEAQIVEESISNLSGLTQEQMAYSEEEKALAQSLESASIVLTDMVSQFKLE